MQQLKVWSFEKNPERVPGALLAEHRQELLSINFFWIAWPSKNFASLGFSGWQNNLDITGFF